MKIGVIGGGIAGSLLAWQLLRARPTPQVELWCTTSTPDATAASGGLVRAFEPDPSLARLAAKSLAMLLADRDLRRVARFTRAGSVYLRSGEPRDVVEQRIRALDIPGGGITVAPAASVRDFLDCPDPEAVAVVETRAGFLSPTALRDHAVRAVTARGGKVLATPATGIRVDVDGAAIGLRRYDAVVVAAGPWTSRLLHRHGFADTTLRTKLIQYQIYEVAGRRPPPFVDETTGLYGRPSGVSGMLLGVPSGQWDVDPDAPAAAPELVAGTEDAAARRLPSLRLRRLLRTVVATDAYAPSGQLGLRPVAGTGGRLLTFTGGSGGAAKTALAASTQAARQLLCHPATVPSRA